MSKKARIKSTEEEKLVQSVLKDSEYKSFNMSENSVEALLDKENTRKFNDKVDEYQKNLDTNYENYEKALNDIDYDINRADIKPMFNRVIIKPFKQNPFQRLEVKNGLIVDAGGYTPHIEMNPVSGKYEEQKEFIITGVVIEVGPEVKYLQEGDVVYYRVDTAVPVPFFKQGLVSLAESQIIAAVNEGLDKRFENVASGR